MGKKWNGRILIIDTQQFSVEVELMMIITIITKTTTILINSKT